MHGWGSDQKVILFVSSRTDTDMSLRLDPSDIVPEYTHLWAQQLSVIDDPTTARDEGLPDVNWARPYITTRDEGALMRDDGLIDLELGPWEIVRLEFTLDGSGVHMSGHDQQVDPTADYDDRLTGGPGDDLIEGHWGDDLLFGGAGDDVLFGGEGDDILYGGAGDDLLVGGPGDDLLYGGAGDDILVGTSGVNWLDGGSGVNSFVASVAGETFVEGFDPAQGSLLSFFGHYDSPEEALERMERIDAFGDGVEGAPPDLAFLHEGGGRTVLLGMAGQENLIEGALADFIPGNPLAQVLEDWCLVCPTVPPPEPESDDGPPVLDDIVDELTLNQFVSVLFADTPEELADALAELDPEELASLAGKLDPNILAWTMPDNSFGVFLNALPQDVLEDFFDRMEPGSMDLRLLDEAPPMPTALLDMSPEVLDQVLSQFSAKVGAFVWPQLSPQERAGLLSYMDSQGISPDDYVMFRDINFEDTQQETDPAAVPLPLPTLEEIVNPAKEEEEDGDEDPALSGGCFVATVVYGDPAHPDVAALRRFRSTVLWRFAAGRAFCRFYYTRGGPWAARHVAGRPLLCGAIRAGLGALTLLVRLCSEGRDRADQASVRAFSQFSSQ
ncbi:MAG: hypothetical protein JJU40_04540 [Rhodobacteraceae bacterium]|nr:hypothetical protein [Paracoccaceae bacterium]